MRSKDPGWTYLSGMIPAVALGMALLTLKAFFPGFMSPDSFSYLDQGKTGFYDDMHAPGMAVVWGILFLFWDNIGSLFTFHTLLYWGSWAALGFLVSPSWKNRLLVLALAALPPLWSQITVAWSDSELSLFLLDAYLLGLWASRFRVQDPKGSRWKILAALSALLFFFSFLVRSNALPALIPLAFFLSRMVPPRLSLFRGVILGLALCVLGYLTSVLIAYGLLHSQRSHPHQLLQTYDIAGVFSRTRDGSIIPTYWQRANPNFTLEKLLKAYTPLTEVPLSFQDDSPVVLTHLPDRLEELNQKWRKSLQDHPGEFIAHRWTVFRGLMGIGQPGVFVPLYFETADNLAGIKNLGNPGLQGPIKSYFGYFQNSLLFRGWFYLCGIAALFTLQWRKGLGWGFRGLAAVCSGLSGLLYGIGYIAYPPSAEFRFLYPVVTLFFLSLILTLGEWVEGEKKGARLTSRETGRGRPPKRAVKYRSRPSRSS